MTFSSFHTAYSIGSRQLCGHTQKCFWLILKNLRNFSIVSHLLSVAWNSLCTMSQYYRFRSSAYKTFTNTFWSDDLLPQHTWIIERVFPMPVENQNFRSCLILSHTVDSESALKQVLELTCMYIKVWEEVLKVNGKIEVSLHKT